MQMSLVLRAVVIYEDLKRRGYKPHEIMEAVVAVERKKLPVCLSVLVAECQNHRELEADQGRSTR